jgi:ABC-2 type transport system ATP-binding protein
MLSVVNITKRYGKKGIEEISFRIEEGTVLAVIGPNGAGKSTLFRVLMDLTKPDSGVCTFNQQPISSLLPEGIGFLPETHYLIPYFSVLEMLSYINTMRALQLSYQQIKDLIYEFDLATVANTKCKRLSQGVGRRVAMASAFMGFPKLLILDEPTNGLDIKSVINFKASLQQRVNDGCTVIVSSHIPDLLATVANQVLFIDKRIIYNAPLTSIMDLESKYKEIFG